VLGSKNLPCGWCPNEDETQEGESTGMCNEHRDQQRLNHKIAQFGRVPSYFGEREQFDRYRERKSR